MRRIGDSTWMTPSETWVCSHEKQVPLVTNGPTGVFWPPSGGPMPMPNGTSRALPATKTVRWAWMWNRTFSVRWHLIPSTLFRSVAFDAGGASSTAFVGIGTCSGPSGPGAGAGCRCPSEESGFSGRATDDADAAEEAGASARASAAAAAQSRADPGRPVRRRRDAPELAAGCFGVIESA